MKKKKNKIMGRPKSEDKRRILSIYLQEREWQRIIEESDRLEIPKSKLVEQIIINSFYQRFGKSP